MRARPPEAARASASAARALSVSPSTDKERTSRAQSSAEPPCSCAGASQAPRPSSGSHPLAPRGRARRCAAPLPSGGCVSPARHASRRRPPRRVRGRLGDERAQGRRGILPPPVLLEPDRLEEARFRELRLERKRLVERFARFVRHHPVGHRDARLGEIGEPIGRLAEETQSLRARPHGITELFRPQSTAQV